MRINSIAVVVVVCTARVAFAQGSGGPGRPIGTGGAIGPVSTQPTGVIEYPPIGTDDGPPPIGTLRDEAAARGLLVGASVVTAGFQDAQYLDTLAREFNFVTPENVMKWGPIHPQPRQWNFGPADQIVDFAAAHAMAVKGHTLIWHQQLPAWVNSSMTPGDLQQAMINHIQTLVGHYRGRLAAWDVVNEAVDDSVGLQPTLFLQLLGDGYIADAFRAAHDADPQARLFYNDYGAEGLGGKSDRVYNLVQGLLSAGAPIHGVGLQMHISASGYPNPADIAANIARLTALGLHVNVSEMDVRIANLPGTLAQHLLVQRQVYHDVLAACLSRPGFVAFTVWGVSDRYSWIDRTFGPDDPLLYDDQCNPKPARAGVEDALLGR